MAFLPLLNNCDNGLLHITRFTNVASVENFESMGEQIIHEQ